MVKVYVVRHAQAGHRSTWDQPDALRPLSPRGVRQAEALRDLLSGHDFVRLLSSPAVRCVDTLVPLAQSCGLEVEVEQRLNEGSGASGPLALISELATGPLVLCSHGDVIPDLLEVLLQQGVKVDGPLKWQKGSAWELKWDGERVTAARSFPPPS